MSSGQTAESTSQADPNRRVAPIPKIAYLCTRYPAVSHTFVLREVNALRRLGVEIATFSVRRAAPEHMLAEADRIAAESTYAILPPRWSALLATHLKAVVRAPLAYFSTLMLALRLAPAGPQGRLWQLFYFVEAVVLWKECRGREIRHIHVHLANAAADTALIAAHLGSAVEPERPWSWSFTMHGPTEFYDVSHFRLAEKIARARFVVCISDYTRSQLMALSSPEIWGRLHVIHVGIPIEQFTRSDNGGPPPEDGAILFIGRLVPEKGEAVLVEAAALLAERGHSVNVTIAGDGPSRRDIEHHAKRLGVASRTSFPGAVGQDDIHAMYAGASIFCLPSFAEGVPGVLMEAMAMELPVVTTRITGIAELVDDDHNGLLVSPGRPDELADALERLLVDPALRREMGSHAREKVLREFNTDVSTRLLRELFAEQLAQ
jgi:colanic acid/amylovoran biosynthesis glycosyltransferase